MKMKRLLTFLTVALSVTVGVSVPATSLADTSVDNVTAQEVVLEGDIVAEATPQYSNSWITDCFGNVMYNNLTTHYTKAGSRDGSAIDTISIHCMAAPWSAKTCADYFARTTGTYASSQYCVGYDGSIAQSVSEAYRAYCTSSYSNDIRAVTIEVGCDTTHPYFVPDVAIDTLVKLCVDICQRNNIRRLLWEGNSALIGNISRQNMTVHRWFAAKACPGDYLYNKHWEIAERVNNILGGGTDSGATTYDPIDVVTPDGAIDVENYVVNADSTLRVRTGPGTSYEQQITETGAKVTVEEGNKYTICWEFTDSDGLVWGRLSDGTGWICLSYTTKVEGATPEEEVVPHTFVAGDIVKVKAGAVWWQSSKTPADFIFQHNWILKSVIDTRAVLGASADGERPDCASPIDTKYLIWVPDEEGGESGGESGGTTPSEPEVFQPYTVKVNVDYLEIRSGPGTNYEVSGSITSMGVFTIKSESAGEGSTKGWGELKSGAGWINLDDVISNKVETPTTPPTTDGDSGSGDSGSGDSGSTTPSVPAINPDIVIGVIVRIKVGANYYGKMTIVPVWITSKDWVVKDVIGDKVVIDKATDGTRQGKIEVKSTDVELASKATISATSEFTAYTVKVGERTMIHIGAGDNFIKGGIAKKGAQFEIVAVAQGAGSMSGWGKLANGKGWIALDLCEKVG